MSQCLCSLEVLAIFWRDYVDYYPPVCDILEIVDNFSILTVSLLVCEDDYFEELRDNTDT